MNKFIKRLSLFSIISLGLFYSAFAQPSKNLVGTWYGKIPAYRFKQESLSQCFSKHKVSNCTRLLIIDSSFNYTYQELNSTDTTPYKGHMTFVNDTLRFNEQAFYLFALTEAELIYSTFPLIHSKEKDSESESIFQPVEVDAAYSKGKHPFLKELYSFLANQKSYSKDSVYLNTYEVIISKDGKLELATLKEVSAKNEYLNAIKTGLQKLSSPFIPCKQNGSYVTARYKFVIAY